MGDRTLKFGRTAPNLSAEPYGAAAPNLSAEPKAEPIIFRRYIYMLYLVVFQKSKTLYSMTVIIAILT